MFNSELNSDLGGKLKHGELPATSGTITIDCGFKPDIVLVHSVSSAKDYRWGAYYNTKSFNSWVNNSSQGGKDNAGIFTLTENGFSIAPYGANASGYYVAIKL